MPNRGVFKLGGGLSLPSVSGLSISKIQTKKSNELSAYS